MFPMLAEADGMAMLQVLIRILHIAAAIGAGGAILFHWIAVRPVLATLDEERRASLGTAIADRWRPAVYTAILVLLATGLLNFFLFQIPAYRPLPMSVKMTYHGMFGAKLLLAFAVFHGATVLTLPAPRGDKYRARAGAWLPYLATLIILIVVLAAVMRFWPNLSA